MQGSGLVDIESTSAGTRERGAARARVQSARTHRGQRHGQPAQRTALSCAAERAGESRQSAHIHYPLTIRYG